MYVELQRVNEEIRIDCHELKGKLRLEELEQRINGFISQCAAEHSEKVKIQQDLEAAS